MVLLDTETPGTSREIYSEDADGETRTRNPWITITQDLHKIYKDYKVKKINIVMDFLANFGKTLPNELKSLGIDSKEILLVLQQSQKWIMTKNCNM